MTWIICGLNVCILAYGAVTDYKRREIPDAVPILLLLTGLFSGWDILLYRIAGMLLTAAIFLLSAKLSKSSTPGGDFKLLCALAFSAGLPILLLTLLLTGLGSVVVGAIRKQSLKRHIPLCSYIAPAYAIGCALQIIL